MRGKTWVSLGGAMAVLLVALGSVAGAGGPGQPAARVAPVMGKEFRVSGPGATADEDWATVAYNAADGQYLVVWEDDRNQATRGTDIYGRRLSATGTVVGADFRISGPDATAWDGYPAVAWNTRDDEYLVVWTDARDAATRGVDVYGRRVSATGVPTGEDFRISGNGATSDDGIAAVAWNAADSEYLVVWGDFRNQATRGEDIYGRLISAAGAPIGADFRISGPRAKAGEWYPDVAWSDSADDYLVVWTDQRNQATRGSDVYGRRVSAAGVLEGSDFRICGRGATLGEDQAAVAWNGTAEEYLVVWQDERNVATRGWDIYGRRVTADGAAVGKDIRISGRKAILTEGVPAVAWNGTAGQYLVVWDDERNATTRGFDVYGRRVAATGTLEGGDFRISGPRATADEWKPSVVWNGAGNEYLVVRADDRNDATRGWDVYGRLIEG